MSVLTVSFVSMICPGVAAQDILSLGYDLKMIGIAAAPDAT
jgi:hypothetical protein